MSPTDELPVPRIYAISPIVQRVSRAGRIGAAIVAAACLAVLITAVFVDPDPSGVSSHESLGLAPCQFLATSGLPCPSCGMTTSFAHFVRGNLAASLWVQPMGALLACAAGLTFWAALYIAITGRPVHRLVRVSSGSYYVIAAIALGIAAWAWKIFIHLRGTGGWG